MTDGQAQNRWSVAKENAWQWATAAEAAQERVERNRGRGRGDRVTPPAEVLAYARMAAMWASVAQALRPPEL